MRPVFSCAYPKAESGIAQVIQDINLSWCLLAIGIAFAGMTFWCCPACADAPSADSHALFGAWDGLKPWLADRGVKLGVVEQAVPSDVVSGGTRQGRAFAGLLSLTARVQLGRLTGLHGLSSYISAWVVQGHGPTAYYVHSLSGLAYVEAPDGARLGDAYLSWYSAHHRIHVKLGKFGIDENFDQDTAATTLLDSNYTYRDIMGTDLPGGGPAYSYEGPGVMVAVRPVKPLKLRGGLFGGNPLGRRAVGPSPPARDVNGLAFPLNSGALVIGEASYAMHLLHLGKGEILAGGLYDTLSRSDLLYSRTGQSLALKTIGVKVGPARRDQGDYILYAGDIQTLWHKRNGPRLRGFVRFGYAPPDRNLVSFSAQGGLVLYHPLPSRMDDSAALAISYDKISPRQVTLIRAENGIAATARPIPSAETDIELDYSAVLPRGVTLTPDFQYIVHPGGGIRNRPHHAAIEPNAVVAQLQLTIVF